LNETFLKAPSAKQLMPPFFREHPDAMDAFKRYGVVHLKDMSIELMHSYVHDSLIPTAMKSLGQAFDEDTKSNNAQFREKFSDILYSSSTNHLITQSNALMVLMQQFNSTSRRYSTPYFSTIRSGSILAHPYSS